MRLAIAFSTCCYFFIIAFISLDTIKYSTCQKQQRYGYDENELTLNITFKGTM